MRKIIDVRTAECPHSAQDAVAGDLLITGTAYLPDYHLCTEAINGKLRFRTITTEEFNHLVQSEEEDNFSPH